MASSSFADGTSSGAYLLEPSPAQMAGIPHVHQFTRGRLIDKSGREVPPYCAKCFGTEDPERPGQVLPALGDPVGQALGSDGL